MSPRTNSRIVQSGRIPLLLRRGGCGINKKSRSHRSAADRGRSPRKPDAKRKRDSAQPQERAQPSTKAVAHTQMFQNAIRNVTRERPPRPRLFGTGPFFGGAATPPLQGGEYAHLKSFTASMTDATQTGLVSIFLFQVSLEIDPERSFFKNSSPETKDFRRPKSPIAGFPDRSLALG